MAQRVSRDFDPIRLSENLSCGGTVLSFFVRSRMAAGSGRFLRLQQGYTKQVGRPKLPKLVFSFPNDAVATNWADAPRAGAMATGKNEL